MLLDQVTNALILVFFFGALGYAGRTVLIRWWRSALGRITAYTAVVYVVVGLLAAAGVAFGSDYTARPWVRLIAWLIISPIPFAKMLILAVAQARGELERHIKGEDHE